MTERRRYTAKERAKAAGIAAVDGVTAAERKTGIPKTTIQYWTEKPEFVQLRTTARDVVRDQFWIAMQIGLKEVIDGIRGDAPLNHKADALRTIADRYALLSGEATVRSESRDITGTLSDSDITGALRAASDLVSAGARRADTPSEVPPEG